MQAADIMVSSVITVPPDAKVTDVANILLRNHISAVPVVTGDGKLVGIVSEGDLMRRPESDTEKRYSPWLEFLTAKEVMAEEFVRTRSTKVSDVMTADVITATPETSTRDIAALLERRRIKRVPIVKDGKLVGIVSRANLLQALASLKPSAAPAVAKSDAELRELLMRRLETQAWARPSWLNATVQDGVAELWGVVETEAEKKAFRTLAEVTPGIRAVRDNVSVNRYVVYV